MTVQDNSAVVRRFTAGLRAGDVAGCLELLDDEIVFSEAMSLPFGGDYLGKDAFVQLLRKVGRDFRVELDTPEIGDAGSFVAVRMHGTMTSRVTGRSMPMRVVDLYQLRGGKIVRVDVFYQDSHAVSELCRGDTTAASLHRDHQGATT
ncbi:nuclear transport factor 2 family protein [Streptomyces sp. GQFP]|uniref:nuclear transport factor 2 family protein n=1 Tax=Streptomyces sp. GQFP TaxID=2907545 RepID=UPI001F475B68|nr:nuclear transport factor 2 family protein [Streptomyces sp. GQFP]UIX29393.1 nuclear transport factor 2 family protein [Streptomyces sp. GQFP]